MKAYQYKIKNIKEKINQFIITNKSNNNLLSIEKIYFESDNIRWNQFGLCSFSLDAKNPDWNNASKNVQCLENT